MHDLRCWREKKKIRIIIKKKNREKSINCEGEGGGGGGVSKTLSFVLKRVSLPLPSLICTICAPRDCSITFCAITARNE